MNCIIIQEEIEEKECLHIQEEAKKVKNGRELPKRFKRIVGWKIICKECKHFKKK